MNDQDTQEFLDEVTGTLEETYLEFLADPTQPFLNEDTALARVTFYKALLEVMKEDPLEDEGDGAQELLDEKVSEMLDHHQKLLDQQIRNYITK